MVFTKRFCNNTAPSSIYTSTTRRKSVEKARVVVMAAKNPKGIATTRSNGAIINEVKRGMRAAYLNFDGLSGDVEKFADIPHINVK